MRFSSSSTIIRISITLIIITMIKRDGNIRNNKMIIITGWDIPLMELPGPQDKLSASKAGCPSRRRPSPGDDDDAAAGAPGFGPQGPILLGGPGYLLSA